MTSDLIITGAREHNLKDITLSSRATARRHHRALGLGQVLARLRHHLRRGPAPLRREPLGLRPPVPRPDGQAGRRLHRGPLAGHLHRPEDDHPQPALHRRARSPRSTTTCACSTPASGTRTAPTAGGPSRARPCSRSSTTSCELARARASASSRRSCAAARASTASCFEQLRADGFTRVRVDGDVRELEEDIELDKKFKHDIDVVVDRLVMKEGLRRRLTDSVETAAALADGLVDVELAGDDEGTLIFSEKFACVHCGISLPEIEPRIFCFNSPHGACPACHGLGFTQEIDPDLIVPDGTISIDQGALLPVRASSPSAGSSRCSRASPRPSASTPRAVGRHVRGGPRAVPLRHRQGAHPAQLPQLPGAHAPLQLDFHGIIKHLERRFEETESEQVRQKIEEYMATAVPRLQRGAPQAHEPRRHRRRAQHPPSSRCSSVREALAFLDGLSLSETERLIGGQVIKEIRARLGFLIDVGLGYLTLERASATLSGGEAQRIRLATQIGSALVGVLYILDEPQHRPAPARQPPAHRHAAAPARPRQHRHRRRARRGDHAPGRLHHRHGPGRRRARRPRGRPGHAAGGHGRPRPRSPATISPGAAASRVPGQRRMPLQRFTVRGARENNLKDIDVAFPLGAFTCVTGVSGSGKTTLVNEILSGWRRASTAAPSCAPATHDGIDGASSSTRSSTSTSRPSAARRAATRPPTPACSTTSASSSRRRPRASSAATSPAASASTSRAAAARPARATGRSRSRCTSCPTSTCPARSARASATTARRSRSGTRARTSPTCWT